MHSLTFDPNDSVEDQQACIRMIAEARPGQIVKLPLVPLTVNIRFPDVPIDSYGQNASLDPTETIVPIATSKYQDDPMVILRDDVIPCTGTMSFKQHPVEIGFGCTFAKVQGRTHFSVRPPGR
jgi:hypothetical protein